MSSFDIGGFSKALSQRAYRRFWIGFVVSMTGSAMTTVAATWIVLQRTHSPVALGLLFVAFTAPVFVGGFLAGWLLDRFDRRQVMIWDNVARGSAIVSIPILNAFGNLPLEWVYAVAAIYGFLFMISFAGGPAIIPELVPPESISTANSLETLGFTLSGVSGPPIAGILIGIIGAPNVFLFDAASYMIFIAALASIQLGTDKGSKGAPTGKIRLSASFQLLASSSVLMSITIMYMLFNIGSGILAVWLPILVSQGLGGTATLYGIILGASAAGETVGAFIGGSYTGKMPSGTLICVSQVLSGVVLCLLLLSRDAWTALISMALLGAASAPLTIWAQTLRMKMVPPELRGRTFALLRTLMQGSTPAGSAAAGLVLPAVGLASTIGLTAGLMSTPGAIGYAIPSLRRAT
jgi:MFS family permease